MVGQLVRVKSEFYPFYWNKPNLFICDEITDHGFALLHFADGDRIPEGSYQGAYLENIEPVSGQLKLFEEIVNEIAGTYRTIQNSSPRKAQTGNY